MQNVLHGLMGGHRSHAGLYVTKRTRNCQPEHCFHEEWGPWEIFYSSFTVEVISHSFQSMVMPQDIWFCEHPTDKITIMRKEMLFLSLSMFLLSNQVRAQSNVGFTAGVYGFGAEYEAPISDGFSYGIHAHFAPSEYRPLYTTGFSLKYFFGGDAVLPYVNVGQLFMNEPNIQTLTATEVMGGIRFKLTSNLALDATGGIALIRTLWQAPNNNCPESYCNSLPIGPTARLGVRWYF